MNLLGVYQKYYRSEKRASKSLFKFFFILLGFSCDIVILPRVNYSLKQLLFDGQINEKKKGI